MAALKALNSDSYRVLNERCEHFTMDMNTFFKDNKISAHISNYRSMMSIRFRSEPVLNYVDAQAAQGHERYAKLFHHLLNNGIYFPPADLEAFFVSTMHTTHDLNNLAKALKIFSNKTSININTIIFFDERVNQ